ncbi:MAG: hypothetical protein OHK006_14840 [Thermodesulfovibrionales bacterium]
MKKRMLRICGAFVLIAGLAANAWAVNEGQDRPLLRGKAENVRERIETLRMWKMTKALELDEKTSAQVFPVMNRYDRKRSDLETALRQDMRELRESVRDGRSGKLRPLLDRIEQNHESLEKLNQDEWRELKQVFSVEQQAKYVIFKQEFEQEIRRMIGEARERRMERQGMPQDRPGPRGPQQR